MADTYILRAETVGDRPRVATLLARTYQTQGVKAIEMASAIRQMTNHKPDLSLVVERAGDVVAAAHFVPIEIGDKEGAVMLAQLALDTLQPDLDVKSVLNQTVEKVAQQGFQALLLQGDPDEFADDGFVEAAKQGIQGPNQEAAALLVKPLQGDKLGLAGAVKIPDFMQ